MTDFTLQNSNNSSLRIYFRHLVLIFQLDLQAKLVPACYRLVSVFFTNQRTPEPSREYLGEVCSTGFASVAKHSDSFDIHCVKLHL